MTQIFNSYENELSTHFRAIESLIEGKTLTLKSFNEMKSILNECQKTIKLLETQQICLDQPHRSLCGNKVKAHKRSFDQYRKKIYGLEHKNNDLFENEKKELLSTRQNSNEMIKNSEMMVNVNEHLRDSVKLMYENLEIGEGVNEELKDQSQRIIRGKEKVVGIRHELGKSERRIKNMMMRIRRNKSILYLVLFVIVLVLVVMLVSYVRND